MLNCACPSRSLVITNKWLEGLRLISENPPVIYGKAERVYAALNNRLDPGQGPDDGSKDGTSPPIRCVDSSRATGRRCAALLGSRCGGRDPDIWPNKRSTGLISPSEKARASRGYGSGSTTNKKDSSNSNCKRCGCPNRRGMRVKTRFWNDN